MSNNSRHGQKLERKFEQQEKARREHAGKMTEAPAKETTKNAESRFTISDDRRA
jgi:hypothetical protein